MGSFWQPLPPINQKEVDLTRPRNQLVSLADTPNYHVVSRCVPNTLRGAGS